MVPKLTSILFCHPVLILVLLCDLDETCKILNTCLQKFSKCVICFKDKYLKLNVDNIVVFIAKIWVSFYSYYRDFGW